MCCVFRLKKHIRVNYILYSFKAIYIILKVENNQFRIDTYKSNASIYIIYKFNFN